MADRIQRVDQLLREELARLIQEDAEELGIIDIVDLETSRDLSTARVFITTLSQEPHEVLVNRLKDRAGDYARRLGRRLNLKRIPHFNFQFDTAGSKINRVEGLLDTLEKQRKRPQ